MHQMLPESDLVPEAEVKADWFSQDTATLGDRLAGAREGLGITQVELARRLGVKLKTLRNWEEDLSEPRANKLQMVSGVLNVSVMWLLNGQGDGLSEPVKSDKNSSDIKDLFSDIRILQSDFAQILARLGQLEQRMRAAVKDMNS